MLELIEGEEHDDWSNGYIQLTHNGFSFISAIILFVIGSKIKSMIQISLKDTNNHENLDYYIEETINVNQFNGNTNIFSNSPTKEFPDNTSLPIESLVTQFNNDLVKVNSKEFLARSLTKDLANSNTKEFTHIATNEFSGNNSLPNNIIEHKIKIGYETKKLKDSEIYFSKRINQIYVVIYSFLLCYLIQLTFSLLKVYFMSDDFQITSFKTFPLTKTSGYLLVLNAFSIILPIFTNYLAFFYIIKDSYKPKKSIKRTLLEKDVLVLNYQNRNSNRDIENFLK